MLWISRLCINSSLTCLCLCSVSCTRHPVARNRDESACIKLYWGLRSRSFMVALFNKLGFAVCLLITEPQSCIVSRLSSFGWWIRLHKYSEGINFSISDAYIKVRNPKAEHQNHVEQPSRTSENNLNDLCPGSNSQWSLILHCNAAATRRIIRELHREGPRGKDAGTDTNNSRYDVIQTRVHRR